MLARTFRIFLLGAFGVPCLLCFASDQSAVGRITFSKGAKVTVGLASLNASYVDAKVNDSVRSGAGIRTGRRNFGEITFQDNSVLRVNERTDMTIQDVGQMRTMNLSKGALWVRVTKGTGTKVQTPVATATVRGTELVIDENGDMTVLDGSVSYEANGVLLLVEQGESVSLDKDGKPVKSSDQAFADETPWFIAMFLPGRSNGNPLTFVGGVAATVGALSGGGSSNPPVPEPFTGTALALGASALLIRRRAKR